MIIFLNENQELDGNSYKIPDKLHTHLMQTLSALNQYKKSKGYKRLNSLINPKYNQRSDKQGKHTDGVYISYNDLKKIDYEFRHMDKNPHNVQRLLNGGEEMYNYVHNLLSQERHRVEPILKKEKQQTREKNQVKPSSQPMRPTPVSEVPKVSENKIRKIYIKEDKLNLVVDKKDKIILNK